MASDDRAFIALDGMRGVAAAVIVASHLGSFLPRLPIESNLAVDFFFVLSGFVLAHAYGERLRTGALSPGRFLLIRVIRLYPLYALGLMIALPLGPPADGGENLAFNALLATFFLPSWAGVSLYVFNPPAWSLFSELLANAWLGIVGRRLAAGLLLATMSAAAAMMIIGVWRNGAMIYGNTWPTFWQGIIRVAYSFPAGILVYRLWLKWKPPLNLPAIVVGLVLVSCLTISPPRFERLWTTGIVLLVFPMLVWFGAASRPQGAVGKVCHWLGAISYAIYILHYPVYDWSVRIARGSTLEHDWYFIAGLIVVIVLAAHLGDQIDTRIVRPWLVKRLVRAREKRPLHERLTDIAREAERHQTEGTGRAMRKNEIDELWGQ